MIEKTAKSDSLYLHCSGLKQYVYNREIWRYDLISSCKPFNFDFNTANLTS